MTPGGAQTIIWRHWAGTRGRPAPAIEHPDQPDALTSPRPRAQPLAMFLWHPMAHQPGHPPGHLVTLVHPLTLARVSHRDILTLLLVNLTFKTKLC